MNHSCSEYSFQICCQNCPFFTKNVRSLSATSGTQYGFNIFVSLIVQENQTSHFYFFSSILVTSLMPIGSKTTRSCSCNISLCMAAISFSEKLLCLVSNCMFADNCKLASHPLKLRYHSCATASYQ